ncbi:hypothetical protein BDB00DRAFT_880605 [Zychaea mexicana]|uniref:uncharacterized protein n=1 Tax=Zychaea mexicana TaxID=64656 RepID=UPI0022FE2F0E|nr:uncharacterized protein BDB00DRAFT_880605 [Zychaea mexicana]KAI9466525.1 hypothetical protein BDB00DRAFT_880605 [Zychaea mexicana]
MSAMELEELLRKALSSHGKQDTVPESLKVKKPLEATTYMVSILDLLRDGKDIPKDFHEWMAVDCNSPPSNYGYDGSGLLADLQSIVDASTPMVDLITARIKTVLLVLQQDKVFLSTTSSSGYITIMQNEGKKISFPTSSKSTKNSVWVFDCMATMACILRITRTLNIVYTRHLFQQRHIVKKAYYHTDPCMLNNPAKKRSWHKTHYMLIGTRYYVHLVREFGIAIVCLPTIFNPQNLSKIPEKRFVHIINSIDKKSLKYKLESLLDPFHPVIPLIIKEIFCFAQQIGDELDLDTLRLPQNIEEFIMSSE